MAGDIPFTLEDRDRLTRIEASIESLESSLENRGVDKDTVNILVRVLKEFAAMDVKMGDILKKFHL